MCIICHPNAFLKSNILLLHIKFIQRFLLILRFKDQIFNSCLNLNTKNIHILNFIVFIPEQVIFKGQVNSEHSICNRHIVVAR